MWEINPEKYANYFIFLNASERSVLRRVPLMEQELLTLPEHMSSPPDFSWVHVTRSSVLCVCFVDHCLSFCTFSFGHCADDVRIVLDQHG
jgi:hypothetical protein